MRTFCTRPPVHSRYLRLRYRGGGLWNAQRCPLAYPPRPECSRNTRAVAAYLRRNVLVFMYLHDWFIVVRSRQETARDVRLVCDVTRALGFSRLRTKVPPLPHTNPYVSGGQLAAGRTTPSFRRRTESRHCVGLFLAATAAPARAWLTLLGFMASLVDLAPWCRLRMRPLQLRLLAFHRPRCDRLDSAVPVTDHIIPHLRGWAYDRCVRVGMRFPQRAPQATVATDASYDGLGASLPPRRVMGHPDQAAPYQCPGVAGGLQRPAALPGRAADPVGPRQDRQYHGSGLYQQARGHEVASPVLPHVGHGHWLIRRYNLKPCNT